jgi:transposase
MDADLYIEILDECIPLTLEEHKINPKDMIFQQDNDPKHTSNKAKAYIEEQGWRVLGWPAQSPDLNPIEHLWAHLKKQLCKFEQPPKGQIELWERVTDVFYGIPKSVCQNLIESMPRRIQAVKKAKGGPTKY